MQEKNTLFVKNILSRLKSVRKINNDNTLANELGIRSNVLSNWKMRNTFDAQTIITYCVNNNIDLNYIFNENFKPCLDDTYKDEIIRSKDEIIILLKEKIENLKKSNKSSENSDFRQTA